MNRDKDIQRIFEIADDSLQGVLGHFFYTLSLQYGGEREMIERFLPSESFPMTFAWVRYYNKKDLVQAFSQPLFEIYQARLSLVSIVTIFEVMLNGFFNKLSEKGFKQKIKDRRLKHLLIWAYDQLDPCNIGHPDAIKRIPYSLGIIDNARRLRNLIIHNQGLFDNQYERDIIKERNFTVDMHPHHPFYKANMLMPIPVLIETNYFLQFSKAHLEIVHLLHNNIQKKYYGCSEGYSYADEKKRIEWTKVLWGDSNVVLEIK